MTQEFEHYWKSYEPLIKALVDLLYPFLEVAVHDLHQGKLAAIYHNISQRKIGDISPLCELKVNTSNFPDYFDAYYKKNWDGRALKCTSVTLRNEKGKAVGLICFNVDASFALDTQNLLKIFLKTKTEAENPIEIFGSHSEEQMAHFIHLYLEDKKLSLNHLNRRQKQDLVQYLYHKGVFNFKNSVPYLAGALRISRASIYNYIKQMEK